MPIETIPEKKLYVLNGSDVFSTDTEQIKRYKKSLEDIYNIKIPETQETQNSVCNAIKTLIKGFDVHQGHFLLSYAPRFLNNMNESSFKHFIANTLDIPLENEVLSKVYEGAQKLSSIINKIEGNTLFSFPEFDIRTVAKKSDEYLINLYQDMSLKEIKERLNSKLLDEIMQEKGEIIFTSSTPKAVYKEIIKKLKASNEENDNVYACTLKKSLEKSIFYDSDNNKLNEGKGSNAYTQKVLAAVEGVTNDASSL